MIDKLSYLGGIIDGEGTISIVRRTTYYVPHVCIPNTNETLISFCKEILDELEIKYCVEYKDRKKLVNSKPCWVIRIEGKERVGKFLEIISNYVVSKKEQATLVANWCNFKGRRRNLTTTDLNMINNIRQLNARGRVR